MEGRQEIPLARLLHYRPGLGNFLGFGTTDKQTTKQPDNKRTRDNRESGRYDIHAVSPGSSVSFGGRTTDQGSLMILPSLVPTPAYLTAYPWSYH